MLARLFGFVHDSIERFDPHLYARTVLERTAHEVANLRATAAEEWSEHARSMQPSREYVDAVLEAISYQDLIQVIGSLIDEPGWESVVLSRCSPDEFENLVALLLEQEGWHAEVTPPTGDAGIDVLLTGPDGSVGVAQAKRWMQSVGRPTVQQTFGAGAARGASFIVVVSSSKFSADALAEADSLRTQFRGRIELWERSDVTRRMLSLPRSERLRLALGAADAFRIPAAITRARDALLTMKPEPPICPSHGSMELHERNLRSTVGLEDRSIRYGGLDLLFFLPPPERQVWPGEVTPKCGACGGPTVRRRANWGTHKGELFYGCADYPRCRGIVPIDQADAAWTWPYVWLCSTFPRCTYRRPVSEVERLPIALSLVPVLKWGASQGDFGRRRKRFVAYPLYDVSPKQLPAAIDALAAALRALGPVPPPRSSAVR